jgi:hypothetical protein
MEEMTQRENHKGPAVAEGPRLFVSSLEAESFHAWQPLQTDAARMLPVQIPLKPAMAVVTYLRLELAYFSSVPLSFSERPRRTFSGQLTLLCPPGAASVGQNPVH